MNNIIVRSDRPAWYPNVILSLQSHVQPSTVRSYAAKFDEFMDWLVDNEQQYASPAAYLEAFARHCLEKGNAPQTVNAKLSAVRTCYYLAVRDGHVSFEILESLKEVRDRPARGEYEGNWYTKEQIRSLINAPDTTTRIGLRDRAVLALLTSALRRSEVSSLMWKHLVYQDEGWVLKNIVGKGNKRRTVTVSDGTVQAILDYRDRGLDEEKIIGQIDRHGNESPGVTPQTVRNIFKRYAKACGLVGAPHDMRRSVAEFIADENGVQQAQRELGHSSLAVTQRYLKRETDHENNRAVLQDLIT